MPFQIDSSLKTTQMNRKKKMAYGRKLIKLTMVVISLQWSAYR